MSLSYDFGKEAELFAEKYFREKGYEIITRNYFFQKAEIDLIVQKDNNLVIVEVKARSYKTVILPEEAVSAKKKKLLIKAADDFILKNNVVANVRFDILALVKQNSGWEINHIEDAFTAFEL